MGYKESIFNIDIEKYDDGKTLIFNTASGALAKFDEESLSRFRNVNYIESSENLDGEIENGFVVDSNKDEMQNYTQKIWDYTHSENDALQITFVPSLGCNYRCRYCFEAEVLSNTKRMSVNLVNDTIEFIKKYLIDTHRTKLELEWFGGEPLLQLDTILTVSRELISFCNDNNIKYHAHMITNGRLYTKDIAIQLRDECKIDMVQITIDGLPEKYAYMKGCRKEDFYKVIDNLRDLHNEKDIHINLRINVSKDNVNDIEELLTYIYNPNVEDKYKIIAGFYLADVRDYDIHSYSLDTFYSFKKDIIDWIRNMVNKDMSENILSHIDLRIPQPRLTSCKATSKEMITIDYQGRIYQCPHFIDKYGTSGDIYNGIIETETRKKAIDNVLPLKCLSCKYLPVCVGHCYADRELDKISVDCDGYIFDINNTIKTWYELRSKK